MSSQGSTAIQAFVFPQTKHKVRVVIDKHGNPWWVAKDVCDVLGLDNVTWALKKLDEDEFSTAKVIDAMGREQETYVVNESGLYALIMTSRKPEAKAFKKWVTSEVLPSIRKTGSYGHKPQQQLDLTNLDPDVMLDALINVQQLRKQEKAKLLELQEEKAKLEVRLEAQTTAVNAVKRLAASEGSVCIQQAAKALKMRPTDLTDHMLNSGWLYMRPPSTRKIAYQEKIKQKWMVCHQDTKSLSGGRELLYVQYKITGLGLLRLALELDFKIDEIESNDD
jgi:prophage antirepressor-like protein